MLPYLFEKGLCSAQNTDCARLIQCHTNKNSLCDSQTYFVSAYAVNQSGDATPRSESVPGLFRNTKSLEGIF